jgi:hypothetical protein
MKSAFIRHSSTIIIRFAGMDSADGNDNPLRLLRHTASSPFNNCSQKEIFGCVLYFKKRLYFL